MKYEVFLIFAVISLITAVVIALICSNKRKIKPITILLCGAILSGSILLIPVHLNKFETGYTGLFEILVNSFYTTVQLLGMEGSYEIIADNLEGISLSTLHGYSVLFSVLLIVIPLSTLGWVLSFFKSVSARIRYDLHFGSDTYIFSQLNERSITLAESLYNNGKNRFLVFTDVDEQSISDDLINRAEDIHAVCFGKDIGTVSFTFRLKKVNLNFFCIGVEETQNTDYALDLIKKFGNRENTNIYVFSTLPQNELLLSNIYKNPEFSKIKVRRINEAQTLINKILYYDGYQKIFQSAEINEGGNKTINAVVVGMGKFGTEMVKALTWFGQMDGYTINIDVFDIKNDCEQKFTQQCPELMEFSGVLDIEGETKYTLSIHGGTDVNSLDFDKAIFNLNSPTYILVALGNDEFNISAAIGLRTLLAKKGCCPKIQAIVYDTDKNKALKNITNYKNQAYDIDFIGDLASEYSEETMLASEIEQKALERHLRWGDEKDFWQFEYNYKSSAAAAIHSKMKVLCGIAGAGKSVGERSDEELWNLRKLEHRRWNAYIRSEGYTYGGTTDKIGRNDLAKTHNCLVAFDRLPYEEQIKDDD